MQISSSLASKVDGPVSTPQNRIGSVQITTVGRFDTFLLLIILAGVIEGIFYEFITPYVEGRSLIIFRLTPFNLYPLDMLVIPLVLTAFFFVPSRNKTHSYPSRLLILLGWWLIGIMGVVVGMIYGNNTIPADIRTYLMRTLIAIVFYRYGINSNLLRVFNRLIIWSVYLALIFILYRALLLLNFPLPGNLISGYGSLALLLPYSVLMMQVLKGVRTFRKTLPMILVISVGILQSFWKPVVVGFVFLNFLLYLAPLFFSRYTRKRETQMQVLPHENKVPSKAVVATFSSKAHFPYRRRPRRFRIFSTLVLGIVCVIGVFFYIKRDYYLPAFQVLYLKQGAPIHDLTGNRFFIWNMALNSWLEHPWLGVGFGKLLSGEVPAQWIGGTVYQEQIYIHNLPLDLLRMTGVVGLTAVSILLLAWFNKVRKTCRKLGDGERATYEGIVVFCLIILVMSCYGETLRYSPPGYLFWAALGIEAAFARHANKKSNFEPANAK